jgi:hypothetical protein
MKEIRDIKIDLLMGNQNPIVDLFCSITSGIEIINCDVYNEDGLEFIYHKDGQWIFYQDCKNEKFWTHYYRYWEILEKEFSLEYEEIQAITKLLVEEALKREVSTSVRRYSDIQDEVEEALKREVSTSNFKIAKRVFSVEEALKREVTTPYPTLDRFIQSVEEALKREVTTPVAPSGTLDELVAVEEALNRNVGTPGNRTKSFPVEEALKKNSR